MSSCLIRKHPKLVNVVNEIKDEEEIVDVNDISIDLGAPTVDVLIDGTLIEGAQIEIGLKTPIILRMVDQSWFKPLDVLRQVLTIIGGLEFKIDYIVFKVIESISSYPILLERPW